MRTARANTATAEQTMMGGNRKELKGGGFVETSHRGDVREMTPADIMKGDDVIGRASDSEESDVKEGVRYGVITKRSRAMCGGMQVTLNAGKIIDSLNYDLSSLKRQSVRMKTFEILVEAEEFLDSIDLG
jgi:hypothetical protein